MTRVLLGLDIGGSASRARLRTAEDVIDVRGPGANVATLDAGVVDDRLSTLLGQLGEARPEACCAGAAGAEVPEARSRLRDLLERRLPGCRLSVVHDARLVLAAAGLEEGIALIAGTGSVAYGRTAGGREAQRGGWGWMVGDDGSGVWIAREAAREVMTRADAGEDLGPLGAALLVACGAAGPRQMIAVLHAMREPMQWASLASAVFATAGADDGSAGVIRRAAVALAALAAGIQATLGGDGPVVLAGGLLLHEPRLELALREQLAMSCVKLDQPPVEGALRLAEGLLSG